MTDIEKKALALLNECGGAHTYIKRDWNPRYEALCRAIEQHEAFRQEVSDALSVYQKAASTQQRSLIWDALTRFIIAKPVDPLVDVWLEAFPGNHVDDARDECAKISEALAKRGGKIVWREGH
jgi:hypothetical protein